MKASRIHRLLRLVTLLQGGRSWTADQLAEELQVSRRTVFRDLNMLELAHVPYYFDPEAASYRISRHFFLPPINLTLPEALAALSLTGTLREPDMPLGQHALKAAMKLEASLPPAIREHVGTLTPRVQMSLAPLSRHEGLDAGFADLLRAAAQRRVCRLVYISFQDRRQLTLEVHPLRLVFRGRGWYLLAWSVEHREVRTFKLARIRSLSVARETFAPHHDADLDNHFGQAWCMIPEGTIHTVCLRFSPKVAGNVAEVRWHATQQVTWRDDGSIDFTVQVDGLGEILWWVLGYGDQVEVLSPAPLRDRLRQTARAMLAMHADVGEEVTAS